MANISSINGNPIVVDANGIQDGSVSDPKLDGNGIIKDVDRIGSVFDHIFSVEYPKNLFDVNDDELLENKYLNPDGRFEDISGRFVTGFIPVVEGKRIVGSFVGGPSGQLLLGYQACCFYKRDKSTIVSGGQYNTNGTIVPSGAKYVRITMPLTYAYAPYSVQVELADEVQFTAYEQYHEPNVAVRGTVDVPASCIDEMGIISSHIKDLTAESRVTYGYFTSEILQYFNQGSVVLLYFKCKPNMTYTISKTYTNNDFKICYIKNEPATGVEQQVYGYTALPKADSTASYTTGEDALYVLIMFGSGNTHTREEILADTSIVYTDFVCDEGIYDSIMSLMTARGAYLPKKIYMVAGIDYEIYHEQICLNSSQYSFTWNQGQNLGNRVRFNFDTAGTKSIKCIIRNPDGTIATELASSVYVTNMVSSDVYLLTFGDSLTNHCVWQSELMNMAENIHCVGSRSRLVSDSDGEQRLVYDEGRAGFTSFNYTSGSAYPSPVSDTSGPEEPNNRWYDPSASMFSTSYYFTNNFPFGQTAPDTITVFLGMNDLLGSSTVDAIVENIRAIVDNMRSYNADISIVMIAPQLRYLPTLSSNERARFIEYATKLEAMTADYLNAVFLPLTIGMDSENNYNQLEVTVNTRSTETEIVASDPTHPAPKGYWQIADYVLGAISYLKS